MLADIYVIIVIQLTSTCDYMRNLRSHFWKPSCQWVVAKLCDTSHNHFSFVSVILYFKCEKGQQRKTPTKTHSTAIFPLPFSVAKRPAVTAWPYRCYSGLRREKQARRSLRALHQPQKAPCWRIRRRERGVAGRAGARRRCRETGVGFRCLFRISSGQG